MAALSIQPNPFKTGATIDFGIFAGSKKPIRLEVFEANGKLVYSQVINSGTTRSYWNGCDHTGRIMGAGIYLFRVSNDDKKRMIWGISLK